MQPLQFDYIVGNPPYNKHIVKPHHDTYAHPAMVNQRSGEIGFYIKCECLLEQGGELAFVTPGKFLSAPGSRNFRNNWLQKQDVVVEAIGKGADWFNGILVNECVILHLRPHGHTGVTIKAGDYSYTWQPNTFPDNIMPKFDSEHLHLEYLRAVKERGTLVCNTSIELRNKPINGQRVTFQAIIDCKDNEVGDYNLPVLTKGNTIVYVPSHLKTSTSDHWRVVIKKCFAFFDSWRLLEPGVEHDYTYTGIVCSSKSDAEKLLAYTKTEQFGAWWGALRTSRHSYSVINLMPRPPHDPAQ